MVSAPLPALAADDGSKDRLRLWVRLLRTSRSIEAVLRERLKTEFDTTLPRFDVMAALYRREQGMRMGDLSQYLLVSGGNVTGIVDRLVEDGLVLRASSAGDRRTSVVRLTDAGRRSFEAMAAAHQGWVEQMLGDVSQADARRLTALLKGFQSNWETGP